MRPRSTAAQNAFTLVELLVVIAIIAILAAIIFPVFATVRENARQSSSISNLRQISTALGQFQLDNHKDPDVLFGYAYYQYSNGAEVSMDNAFSQAQADGQMYPKLVNVSSAFPGLYPEYVHDVATFRDADNPDNGNIPSKIANGANTDINVLGTTGILTASTQKFYAEDAYDVSPQITANAQNQLNKNIYVARYQPSWTNIDNGLNSPCDGTNASCTALNSNGTNVINFYTHQLRWKNPPAETYVTTTTYHVPPANVVLVLFEGGNVKKINVNQFQQYGTDPSTIAVTGSGTVSPANFWKLVPAGR